jgi:hypothetical protein
MIRRLDMALLSDFAEGFLAMTTVIWILNIMTVVPFGHIWMGLSYFFVLLIPVSVLLYTHLKRKKNDVDSLRRLLLSLYGVCLACWVFDIVTTYYAINVKGGTEELNPLGFPFGVFGALVFYVPTSVFIYVLLFQLRHRLSLLVAFLLTFLSLYMGFMNLGAGLENLGFSSNYFPVLLEMTFALLAVLTRSLLAFQIRKRSTTLPKRSAITFPQLPFIVLLVGWLVDETLPQSTSTSFSL